MKLSNKCDLITELRDSVTKLLKSKYNVYYKDILRKKLG